MINVAQVRQALVQYLQTGDKCAHCPASTRAGKYVVGVPSNWRGSAAYLDFISYEMSLCPWNHIVVRTSLAFYAGIPDLDTAPDFVGRR